MGDAWAVAGSVKRQAVRVLGNSVKTYGSDKLYREGENPTVLLRQQGKEVVRCGQGTSGVKNTKVLLP